MDGLLRRVKQRLARERAALAARSLGDGAYGDVARYVDAALAELRGVSSTNHWQILQAPPVASRVEVANGKVCFSPATAPNAVTWFLATGPRNLPAEADWKPSLRKLGINRWSELDPRLDREVRSYSNLERYDYAMTAVDPAVDAYCEQVNTGIIRIGEHRIRARMDRWVRFTDGTECIREVKYLSALHPEHRRYPNTVRQLVAELLFALAHRVSFEVVTDGWFRCQAVLLFNRQELLQYGFVEDVDEDLLPSIEGVVQRHGAADIERICRAVDAPYDRARQAVLYLLCCGRLVAQDLDTEHLSDHTIVGENWNAPSQDERDKADPC